jgi:lipocalin/ligand-binding SRPBCC domain-containing protein
LKSRVETGETLRASGVPVIEFRASVVIGAGSLSFEMIQALVERLPAMICPRWVDTLTQPIAIDDVLAYLEAALDAPGHMAGIFEIGGPEVVSYGDMMRRFATLRGLRRLLLPVPVLTPHLSGLWLALVTPAHARVGRALVEGLKNSTVVRSTAASETFRIAPMPFDAAVVKALDDGAPARLKGDTRTVVVDVPPAQAFAPIRRIGGDTGWYFGNVLWEARGWLDRWLGGVGITRGRRDPDDCAVGDTIDGWTVEAFEPDRRLRLSANLKLPGRGWLEFAVTPLGTGRRSMIRLTATFDPRGWMGRAYWYAILPVHALIFRGLLRQVARRARYETAPTHPPTFAYGSIIDAPAAEVFRWHEQPGALAALTPPALVRIEEQEDGIRDGGRVTVSLGIGPARVRWTMRHYGYVAGRRFCDEQVRGPFAVWRHAHLFEPVGPSQTLYQDRLEFAVSRHGALNRVAAALLRPVLTLAFAHRHRTVRACVGRARSRIAPRLAAAVAVATAATLLPATAPAQTGRPVRAVSLVDLDRYAGDWFEIARFPNRFQRQCLGDVRASYSRRADRRIDVVNRCRSADGPTEAHGVARIVDTQTFARLKVRFAPGWLSWLPMVWGDYWIIGLAPDYSWAVVGDPDRDYLWILARTPQLSDASVAAARAAARDNGFDIERLVPTPQSGGGS